MSWNKILNKTPDQYDQDEDETQIAKSPYFDINSILPAELRQAISPVMQMAMPKAEAATVRPTQPNIQQPKVEENEPSVLQPQLEESNFDSLRRTLSLRPSAKMDQRQQPSFGQTVSMPSKEDVKQFITNEARKRGRDPALVLAHFEQESNLNPSALNKKGGGTGARGISQIRGPAFEDAKKFDKTGTLKNLSHMDMSNPKNWKENIIAGLNYYDAIDKYWEPKTEEEFLKSYNQGSPTAKGYKSKEAKRYAKNVLEKRKKYSDNVNKMDDQRIPASEGEVLADEDKFNRIRKLLP